MLFFGPISSMFDITTFVVMWCVFGANTPATQTLFQSGWFVVGLLTQTLIVHMIRTPKMPFIQSRAAAPLLAMTLAIMAVGIFLPMGPLADYFKLQALPLAYFAWLAGDPARLLRANHSNEAGVHRALRLAVTVRNEGCTNLCTSSTPDHLIRISTGLIVRARLKPIGTQRTQSGFNRYAYHAGSCQPAIISHCREPRIEVMRNAQWSFPRRSSLLRALRERQDSVGQHRIAASKMVSSSDLLLGDAPCEFKHVSRSRSDSRCVSCA